MSQQIQIVPESPFEDGIEAGRDIGQKKVQQDIRSLLKNKHLKTTIGAMSRQALKSYVMSKLETPPDYNRYPELEDLYPERIDFLRGFADGAGCKLEEAAVLDYLTYRQEIDNMYYAFQLKREPKRCSGILLVGPDGVIGGKSSEGDAPPPPKNYRYRTPKQYTGLKRQKPTLRQLVLKKPRTGYIQGWGATNEKGVANTAGVSCSVWLDEPIEDVWPISKFPLLRFACSVEHLAELYKRYTLYVWGRASQVWADTSGNGIVVEKSFRRIGIRKLKGHAIWCTEGHFESPEMSAYIKSKRLEYIDKMGKHLGSEDMQYATDCAVRFTHIGELCHMPWGRGHEHMRRILTDHAPFPRAVCRHCGPDTAPYDRTVTMGSHMVDITHNRSYSRSWGAWNRFACQAPEKVTHFPPRPFE